MNFKDVTAFVGVMMFLFGALCLDSSLKIGAIFCLSGAAIVLIGDSMFN